MTRTINVTDPHTGLKTTKVTLNFQRTATIDDVTGDVTYSDWSVVDGSKNAFDDFTIPAVAGYTPEINSGTEDELKSLVPTQDQITNWPDQTVDIDYTADDQSMTIDYVDEQGHPVDGGHFVVSGKTDQTVDTNAKIPAGWVLVSGQTAAPAKITFHGAHTDDIKVVIEHGKRQVDHNNPDQPGTKTPTGKDVNGTQQSDLNQTITRTINITEPSQATKTTTQTAKIYRDATVDEVTGEVTYGDWSTDATDWTAVDIPVHAGYTVHQSDNKSGVPNVTVADGQRDVTINITYTANDQSVVIKFVDDDKSGTPQVGSDITKRGVTDQTITDFSDVTVPENYQLANGQSLPTSYKFTAAEDQTITIHLVHQTEIIDGDHPDGIPSDVNKSELIHKATRIIKVNGRVVQTLDSTITRSATYDKVTEQLSHFSNWTTSTWEAFTPAIPAGYSISKIEKTVGNQTTDITSQGIIAETINDKTLDTTINVTYTADEQSVIVRFVDDDNKDSAGQPQQVGSDITETGVTDQIITDFSNVKVPKNYQLANGQHMPTNYLLRSGNNEPITIHLVHQTRTVNGAVPATIPSGIDQNQFIKKVTRTINEYLPSGPISKIQTATITRSATYDKVTKKLSNYSDWTKDEISWTSVAVPTVDGYTATITQEGEAAPLDSIKEQTVDENTQPVVINVRYNANNQSVVIRFVDDDKSGTPQVGSDITKRGVTDQNITDFSDVTVPENYQLVNGQSLPTSYKFTADKDQIITIHLIHQTEIVDGSKPNKYPSDLSQEDKDRLTKDVVRTINEYLPAGNVTKTQTATLTRTATYDKVTKKLIVGSEGPWQSSSWAAFDVDKADGYTATITQEGVTTPLDSIKEQTVDENTQPVVINVTYSATASAKLTGNGSATYTGQPITTGDLNNESTGLKITVTGPTATTAGTLALNAGDVEFSTDGTTWTTTLPTNAATYQVRLTTQGENAIKSKYGNNNIVWTDKDGHSTITSDATFTINPLSANAVLNNISEGNYTKVYDGSATTSIDPAKLGITVQLNGQSVNLDMTGLNGRDFQWVDAAGNALSEAPKNVGTYYIKLTGTALTILQAHNKNFTLTNSGLGTYIITQAQASATLSGAGTRAYNGSGVTLADLNRADAKNNITLTLHYPKNGDANYSETVQLTADDFVWNTPDGKAPVNANSTAYTISLKSSIIKILLENAAGKGQNNQANVTVADSAITGSASYKITPLGATATLGNVGSYGKTYDATSTNEIDPAKLQFTTNVNGHTVVLNNNGLTGSDFAWVDANGNALSEAPKNVGTYYIKLTDAGLTELKADNPNFTLTSAGQGTYTISQAQGTATLSGSNDKTYNGQAITTAEINSNGQVVVNLTFPGSDANAKYTLADGDYTITPNDSADSNLSNAGTYTITLTAAGKAHVKATMEEMAGKGQDNQANVTVVDNAINGGATFTVNASKNVVNVSGNQTATYTGQPINVAYNAAGTTGITVSIANATDNTGPTAGMTNVHLSSGDFQIVDASGHSTTAINAGGTYHIVLTADGVTKVQNAVGKNYQITQGNSYGTLVINKAYGSVTFSGNPSYTYTGSANPDYLKGFSITLDEPNNPTYTLVAGDIEFNVDGTWTKTAPINHGTYQVRLSQAGWNHIKAINSDNITWSATASAGTGTYTIKAATATTELSGSNQMVYNGNAVTTDDLYTNGSTINVAISGENIANLPSTYQLTDGDYTWNTSDHSAPKNQGDYTITLTKSGLDKIQAAIDAACVEGNVTLSRDNTGSATFHITQAVVSNLQLHGNEQSTYNGQAVQIDPSNSGFKKNYGFNNSEGLTIPDMTADDFEWVDADGNAIAAPKDAGTYYLQLSKNGRDKIANANPNYTFADNKGNSLITGRITYTINPATLVIGVSGTASKVYDGQNAAVTQEQINHGDIKLVWGDGNTSLTGEPTDLGGFTLTPDDLEVVDSSGNPVVHANASANETTGNPVYHVRLKSSVLNTLKGLTGAKNYDISLSNSVGNYLIYQHKAQVTLSGNQTTIYGTDLPLDATKYSVELTNWKASDGTKPDLTGIVQAGDVYIDGYATADKMPNGQMPKDVGTYQVMISSQLLNRLKQRFPDYDWDAVEATGPTRSEGPVEAEHDPATYVIKQAEATVKINGAQHIKYGESANIQYGGTNGYTISITAPANGETKTIYSNANFDASDLQFVTTPGNVGQYTVKLSAAGLAKLATLTGSSNYDWRQATDHTTTPTATFYVDQMPVTITVNNDTKEVTYGTSDWLTAIKHNPSGYTLTVTTDTGSTLTYAVQDGDLLFSQTPGNVGSYNVVLSDQGLANIKQALGTNYAYPQAASDVTTYGTFNVNQGTATVTLAGSDGKTYDGKATTSADLDPTKYSYSATVYAPDGTAQTITLTNDDLQFVDAHGNAITPTSVGTYTVALSPSAETRLKNLTGNNGDNYQWTFDTNATYKISASSEASAALSGSNQKVFDGSGVTTAQINNGGSIEVKFTYPGSTDSSTCQLQDGDYDWYDGTTKLTEAPSQKGTYTIKLTSNGLAHLQAAIDDAIGRGNVTLSADQLSGSATFEIVAKPISGVTISGNDQSKTYDGQGAGLDLSGLNISGTDTVSGTPLSKSGLTADDFDWYENGTKLTGAPTKVGTYEARLTNRALTALQNANPNYSFSEVNGTIKYTINPKAATDKLGGNGTKTYNGQGTSVSDVVNSVTWTPGGLVTGEHLDLSSLTNDDYEWMTKNADGTYTAMTGLPTNVGTYYLKLKDSGIAKIKNANTNYSFADGAISGMYTYTITAATGSATLNGSASKTYDGHSVTTAEVNSTDGNIQITFTIPAGTGTTQRTYQLQDGDYTWETADGHAPTNAGTYTIKINSAKLQSIINQIAGKGNVTIDGDTGSATFKINKKDLDVTLGDKTGSTAGKIYDGQAGVINPNDGSFTTTGLISGESLNTANIPANDYQWVDENGNPLTTTPTDAGTYYVALNVDGLKKLQDNNPNYNITESGKFKYVISPAEADITIGGRQESTTAEITNSNFSTSAGTGITIPTGLTYQFTNGTPNESGTYDVTLTSASLQSLKDANKNYRLKINSTATFTLDATLTITFEDTTEGNVTVPHTTVTKTGANGNSVDLNLTIPENYELAAGQTLPTSYTFGKSLNQSLNIKLVHKTKTVDPTKPDTNPDPTNTDWFKQNDLTKDVTRTINYTGLTADQLSQIPDSEKSQTVHFTRTAQYDLVTGKLVPNSEGTWTAVDGKDTFAGFTPHEFAGYTADRAVPEATVSGDDSNSTITVTYTANDQSMKIIYVDDQGNPVTGGTFTARGKTGQTVDTNAKIPTGWVLVPGQTDAPQTITFTGTPTADITIKIKHGTTSVLHTDPLRPGAKTPTGQPINGAHEDDLNQTITRKITIHEPGKAAQTITQEAHVHRDATYDDVTGEVTYGDWSQDADAWKTVVAPTVAGYTPSQAKVDAVTVKDGQKDVSVNITYTANDQSMKITYVDQDGNTIKSYTISGKTDQTVDTNANVPAGWVLSNGQTPAPTTITFGGNPTADITIKIEHGTTDVAHTNPLQPGAKTPTDKVINGAHADDLNQIITRTITIHEPGKAAQTITQEAHIYRDATYDNVTGEVTYGDWSQDATTWKAVNVPTVDGYTPSQAKVDAVTVKDGQKDVNVNITYTPNDQSMKITYVDQDGNTIKSYTISGKTDQTVNTNAEIPTGWVLVPGQTDAPQTITFTGTPTTDITIKIKHGTTNVSHTNPIKPDGKTPTGQPINGAHEDDLNQTITRKITIHEPGKSAHTITQEAHIYRDATYDDVTGEVTYGDWSQDADTWKAVDAPTVAGYTPSQVKVDAVTVKDGQNNVNVDITYTANDQSMKIIYVDDQGNPVAGGTFNVSGKTDQTVNTNAKIPAGWVLVPGQTDAPQTITFTGTPTADITIKIQHGMTNVSHTDPIKPGGKTSTGQEINGAHEDDLNRTVTRTINVYLPDGTTQQVVQTAQIFRDATVDEVTGEVTYGAWSTDITGWTAYTAPAVAGYTPDNSVSAVTVDENTKDTTVDIRYTANEQSMKITYVDQNNNTIKSYTISGKTDQTVNTNAKIPAGWVLAPGQTDAPTTITFTDTTKDITITIEHGTQSVPHDHPVQPGDKTPTGQEINGAHEDDLNRTVTRTINLYLPDGTTQQVVQTAKIFRDATVDEVTGDVTYGAWSTDTTGWTAYTAPAVTGYTPDNSVSAVTVDENTKDTTVDIRYTATDQTMYITYVDEAGHAVDGGSFTVTGKAGQTVNTNAKIPAGWVLAPGQHDAPTTITFGATPTADIRITVVHGTTHISHDNPVKPGDKTPSGKDINGAYDEDLNQTITRTITVHTPGQTPQVIKQVAKIYRDATVDDVTGEVTYGNWSEDAKSWAEFDAPVHAGYTASPAKVGQVTVKNGQKDVKIDITYAAAEQTGQIIYQDVDNGNAEVGHTDLSGKTGDTITITPQAPAGFEIVPGQNIPSSEKVTADGIPTVTVKVQHRRITVTPGDLPKPGDKVPGNPDHQPGDHTPKTDISYEDLHKTMTRTINVTGLHTGLKTTTMQLHYERTATIDDVTGNVTYSDWRVAAGSKAGFDQFDIPAVPGYTPSITRGIADELNALTPTQDQINSWTDQVVDINYVADQQTGKISYVGAAGNEVGHTDLAGKTGDTIVITPQAPAGWRIIAGQSLPSTVVAGPDGIPTVVVEVEHAKVKVYPTDPKTAADFLPDNPTKHYPAGVGATDLNKVITRTITLAEPDGTVIRKVQTVHLTRSATVDEVTGEITYDPWTTGHWDAYAVPQITGYTPSQSEVAAKDVTSETPDEDVYISYSRNSQDHPDHGQTPGDHHGNGGNGHEQQTPATPEQGGNGVVVKGEAPVGGTQTAPEQHKLPQTGNDKDNWAVAGLGLLSMLGLYGLRRKKRD